MTPEALFLRCFQNNRDIVRLQPVAVVYPMISFRNRWLELGNVRVSTGHFPRHTHDEFVISVNMNGYEHVWIDGQNFEADAKTITTYNPGQIQSSRVSGVDEWLCASLYVRPGAFEHYFQVPFEFSKPYVIFPDLANQLIAVTLASPNIEIEEHCVALLQGLLDAAPSPPEQGFRPGTPARISRIQDRMLGDLSVVPDLESLAASEGVSPAHLVRSFRQETGIPPLAWLMQQRIAHARQLLRVGKPITEAALDTGFADQAHFTKAFVRFMGMTPGQFRHINF